MPQTSPSRLNNINWFVENSPRCSLCICSAHVGASNTPSTRKPKRSATIPAMIPPRITRPKLIFPIQPPCELVEMKTSENSCFQATTEECRKYMHTMHGGQAIFRAYGLWGDADEMGR